ncbi:MAG: molybdopterin-guanine dinucleotide biosynthesis protein B [Candidatus Bipolaricaulaceae bacterium]
MRKTVAAGRSAVKVVAFIGHQGSGKTAFLCRLIPALAARGWRVGTAKHVAPEVEADVPGKDTYLHRQAGAERVLLYSDAHGALFWDHRDVAVEAAVGQYMGDLDIVLLEGFKESAFPKVEVYRSGEPLAGRVPVLAVVADRTPRLPDGVRPLPRDPELVADFLEAELLDR